MSRRPLSQQQAFQHPGMPRGVLSGISSTFVGLFQTGRQVVYVLLTRAPLYSSPEGNFRVRLACVKHAASVRSEPGSNSWFDYPVRRDIQPRPSLQPQMGPPILATAAPKPDAPTLLRPDHPDTLRSCPHLKRTFTDSLVKDPDNGHHAKPRPPPSHRPYFRGETYNLALSHQPPSSPKWKWGAISRADHWPPKGPPRRDGHRRRGWGTWVVSE